MTTNPRMRYVMNAKGEPLTIADLPPSRTKRWTKAKKSDVVSAVRGGLISLDAACEMWGLRADQLLAWKREVETYEASFSRKF